MVLRNSFTMVLAGVVACALAVAAIRLLLRLIEGTRGTDQEIFGLAALVLIAAAMIASFVPARHASRIDPMKALRHD